MELEPHTEQSARWPASGRHILAQFDAESVVVYQAYRPETALWAVEHGRFGGPTFSFGRMSWIKPNFLWMMYRCGWATKPGQEHVLAVRLKRAVFDAILKQAVPSTFVAALYPDPAAWQAEVGRSQVRLQWDPDHGPSGAKLERRAIQLGLRGPALAEYATPLAIEDITPLVREQHGRTPLLTPREDVYPVTDGETRRRLGL
jgi:Domain of unknown function (DUF4291)